ncbi:hypothetical protein OBG91_07460 [Lactococcus lactis]|nr:hypothetical protein [Lactococcus lactis]
MTETAKERIYRGALETMSDSDFMGNKYVKKFVKGVFKQIEDVPATTDKLSVEKLQEHLLPYKKEMVQKIIDEKMQLVTADEFLKLHKESLTAIRENDKLQEQLNIAKKALTEIAEIIDDNIHECNYGCDNSCELNGSLDMYSVENVQSVIDSALTAIGG